MALEQHIDSPLATAVRAAGSQSAFARLVGRRQSTVFGWLKDGKPLPAEHVLTVEAETGVSKNVLRPDIYPPVVTSGRLPTEAATVEAGAAIGSFDRSTGMKRVDGE